MKNLSKTESLTVALIAVISIPISVPMRGWALSKLWGWFLVPLGLEPISWVLAIGISLLVGYLTHQSLSFVAKKELKAPEIIGNLIGEAVLTPVIMVFFGWIIQKFL